MTTAIIPTHQAIRDALGHALETDPKVYVMGLGANDPKGLFGTTLGLADRYPERVLDMPCAENGMTGIAIGSALSGMRPVLTHQRMDFFLLSLEQIVNQAAKWHYMFAGQMTVPMVIRVIVGQGWGQGPQHSQSLHAWLAHIPGLKVLMPATPYDAKGLLLASLADPNPVVFVEHRWTHNLTGTVPQNAYTIPLDKADIKREGRDVSIVSMSQLSIVAMHAADVLADEGISVEVVDLRSVAPIDKDTLLKSVAKTGRLLALDMSWSPVSVASEILALVAEAADVILKQPPVRLTHPHCPSPTSPALAPGFYTQYVDIIGAVKTMLGHPFSREDYPLPEHQDIPDPTFKGPF